MDFVPPGLLKAAIAVAILVAIVWVLATGFDFVRHNPLILILLIAVVGGGIYFLSKRKAARNRV